MRTKKRLMVLGILLTLSLSLILTAPLYARPEFGDDCISCHTGGGIALSSNVSGTVSVGATSSFQMQVEADGAATDITLIWSAVANNPYFAFIPSRVTDNGPNDIDAAEHKVTGNFQITAPAIPGEYTIQVFAAGSEGTGATLTFLMSVVAEGLQVENLPPSAYFLYVRQGFTMEFEDRSWDADGNITSWHWNFGDKTNSTEQNPTHTFVEPGTYTVTLTVTDNKEGRSANSRTFTVPSKRELLQLWTLQVFVGSIMIILTTLFAMGIAQARFKGGRKVE